jgi:predicted mannosyl-3-phosphoglycerate phosphatase (HAD superfamily)
MTNLPPAAAERANYREYSEPVKWLGEAQRKADFVAALHAGGASVLSGGRFLSVSGDCDKGRALVWLRSLYQESRRGVSCHDLAIGDSANDCAMLEAAETALLVRSPVHAFPALSRSAGLIRSEKFGPAGWAEGVRSWLDSYYQPK